MSFASMKFGMDVATGRSGGSGSSGSNGQSVTIFAQQLQQRVRDNLSGRDGDDGSLGGDGADAVIYYSDLSQLKKILIYSVEGEGGRGRGAYGGRGGAMGCRCTFSYWEMLPLCEEYTDKDGKRGSRCDEAPRFSCQDSYTVKITHVRPIIKDTVVHYNTLPESFIQTNGSHSVLNLGAAQFEDSDKLWNKDLLLM